MAQHILINNFMQKSMRKIEENIRKQGYFRTSLKYEMLTDEYKETPEDQVFVTYRSIPKSITGIQGQECFEVHTKPIYNSNKREVTNIYLVV